MQHGFDRLKHSQAHELMHSRAHRLLRLAGRALTRPLSILLVRLAWLLWKRKPASFGMLFQINASF